MARAARKNLDADGAAVVAFDDEVDLVLTPVGAQAQTILIREFKQYFYAALC